MPNVEKSGIVNLESLGPALAQAQAQISDLRFSIFENKNDLFRGVGGGGGSAGREQGGPTPTPLPNDLNYP